jgi:hypothetical protein
MAWGASVAVGWWVCVAAATALAGEPDEQAELPTDTAVAEQPPDVELDPSSAEELAPVTDAQNAFLKPRHHLLEQNPYGQVDFTAYTLEWGELKVGLASIAVGALPRVQVSTVPLLDALKVYNGVVKWDALRAGPVDLAASTAFYVLPLGEFVGSYIAPGAVVSWRVVEPFSLHLGGAWVRIRGAGVPDLTKVPGVLHNLTGAQVDQWDLLSQRVQSGATLDFRADGATLKLAADYRFNRRDSLVFQFFSIAAGRASGNADVPMLGIGESFDASTGFLETWTATLSYQATFKQLDVRLGGGASAYPGVWAIQANDVSYRMFGKTRRTEARMKAGWRGAAETSDAPE